MALFGAKKDPNAGSSSKGGTNAGHPLLLGQNTETVTTLEENLHQISACCTACAKQQFKSLAPKGIKKTH